MKLNHLIIFASSVLVTSCVALKKLPKGVEEITAEVVAEKKTQGNEKIISLGVVPPLFANIAKANNSAGLFASYNAFHTGNAYGSICYYPPGIGILDPNAFTNLSPVTSELRYSFPILKFSKTRSGFMEFDRNSHTIDLYGTNICYKKSINLRMANHVTLNQFEGRDLDADNSAMFSYLIFVERQSFISPGLSYVIFLDHQSHLKVNNKVYKNTVNQFVELFFDLNLGYKAQIAQTIDPDENVTIPSQLDDFKVNSFGYQCGVKYGYVTKRLLMNFHLGYVKLPGYAYVGAYSESKRTFNSTFVFGLDIGFAQHLKTEGRIF